MYKTFNLKMMKQVLLFFLFVLINISCNKTDEVPLLLPSGAEPSAKIYNDRGIVYFNKGKYLDALIAFTQANVADNTTGEIHFNLALMQYLKGGKKEAKNHFMLAQKFADGNEKILESTLLKQHLDL